MAKEDQVVADGEVQVVAFKLRNEEYGFSILNVQEIKNLSDITRVPFAPDFIKGVVNLRGSVLPVIDLKKRLGLEDTPYTANTRIVIVQYDEGYYCWQRCRLQVYLRHRQGGRPPDYSAEYQRDYGFERRGVILAS